MVALVSNGVCVAGWIYDVLQDSMAHAFLGEGAYIDNSAHLTPKITKSFDEMIVHLSPKFFPADIKAEMKAKSAKLPNVYTVGCSAHEYMNVAKGLSDSIVYCRLMPWDHLAGSLIVQEAGGVVSKWDSIPYRPQDLYDGLIIARSQDGWQKVYDKFFADMDMDSYMQARRDKLRRQGKI
jgi:fructose-1,6-bisphosphatase/inositol monophosphatase family enzyme